MNAKYTMLRKCTKNIMPVFIPVFFGKNIKEKKWDFLHPPDRRSALLKYQFLVGL